MHACCVLRARACVCVLRRYLSSAMDLGSLHPLPYESIHPTNKAELARRLALGMRSALLGERTVFRGPTPKAATWQWHASSATTAPRVSGEATITFDVQAGAGGLALDATAACPSVVLDVYCRRTQLLGFEIQTSSSAGNEGDDDGSGAWEAPARVALSSTETDTVVLTAKDGSARISRVRYAYSDWPVVSLRNQEGGEGEQGARGGLPARLFDIGVSYS